MSKFEISEASVNTHIRNTVEWFTKPSIYQMVRQNGKQLAHKQWMIWKPNYIAGYQTANCDGYSEHLKVNDD